MKWPDHVDPTLFIFSLLIFIVIALLSLGLDCGRKVNEPGKVVETEISNTTCTFFGYDI